MILTIKACIICSTEFSPATSNAKYCSDDCRTIGRRQTRKEWKKRNPNYDKDRMKIYREEKKQLKLILKGRTQKRTVKINLINENR